MTVNLDPNAYPKHPEEAPTSKIVQIKEHNQVLCEDGSVWIVKHWKGKGDKKHKNEWECLIEPFNGKQYEFVEKIRIQE